jgi:hypothetical protein
VDTQKLEFMVRAHLLNLFANLLRNDYDEEDEL